MKRKKDTCKGLFVVSMVLIGAGAFIYGGKFYYFPITTFGLALFFLILSVVMLD